MFALHIYRYPMATCRSVSLTTVRCNLTTGSFWSPHPRKTNKTNNDTIENLKPPSPSRLSIPIPPPIDRGGGDPEPETHRPTAPHPHVPIHIHLHRQWRSGERRTKQKQRHIKHYNLLSGGKASRQTGRV
jgi:hypothetical protein